VKTLSNLNVFFVDPLVKTPSSPSLAPLKSTTVAQPVVISFLFGGRQRQNTLMFPEMKSYDQILHANFQQELGIKCHLHLKIF